MKSTFRGIESIHKNASAKSVVLFVFGISIVIIAGVKLADWYSTTQLVKIPSASLTITHSDSTPNEAKIDPSKITYNVAPDLPKKIEIASARISGYIQQVGIDQNNAIATPSNIKMAGWYNGSVKPGKQGISIIDGHVHGRFEPGIFASLRSVKNGDTVTIEFGDGSKKIFTVTKTAQYNYQDAGKHLYDEQPGSDKQLVLITCSGRYDWSAKQYQNRYMVYAQTTL